MAVPRGERKLCAIKGVASFHWHNSTIVAQCVFSSLATHIDAFARSESLHGGKAEIGGLHCEISAYESKADIGWPHVRSVRNDKAAGAT
jgi:hypothetical protein